MKAAGYVDIRMYDDLPYNHFLVAEKPAGSQSDLLRVLPVSILKETRVNPPSLSLTRGPSMIDL